MHSLSQRPIFVWLISRSRSPIILGAVCVCGGSPLFSPLSFSWDLYSLSCSLSVLFPVLVSRFLTTSQGARKDCNFSHFFPSSSLSIPLIIHFIFLYSIFIFPLCVYLSAHLSISLSLSLFSSLLLHFFVYLSISLYPSLSLFSSIFSDAGSFSPSSFQMSGPPCWFYLSGQSKPLQENYHRVLLSSALRSNVADPPNSYN
jgi:hypothetical protein